MIFHTQGGRISVGLLRRLAEIGMIHGDGTLQLGGRQEIVVSKVPREARRHVRHAVGTRLVEHHPKHPNLVTTRSVCSRPDRTPWLSEGTYDTILQSFHSAPGISVDIVDPRQTRVPLFTGEVHFVATPEPDYWILYLNHGDTQERSSLARSIHSNDIATTVAFVQQYAIQHPTLDLPHFQNALETVLKGRMKPLGSRAIAYPTITKPLAGFELDGKKQCFSLGIPLQSRSLPGPFLVDLALLADQHSITNVYTTPWKGLLIHGISATARPDIERLLLRHRINLHPGAWEQVCLNGWLGSSLAGHARKLLYALNEQVPHAGTLSIALVNDVDTIPDTPIIVRAETPTGRWLPWRPRPRFSLFSRENFERYNPNLVAYGQSISPSALAEHVIALIGCYAASGTMVSTAAPRVVPIRPRLSAHRCDACDTEYDERYGDPLGNVPAGTPFLDLPEGWTCPTCGAPPSSYKPVHHPAA